MNTYAGNYEGKKILITGGTGSWGQELTNQLLKNGVSEVKLFSRNELNQVNIARKFKDFPVKCIIGDVRDIDSLDRALVGVDYVFHLAALKHVPLCEEFPYEAIQTNINGTKNIIEASLKQDVERAVLVSTDKAVSPYNLYGMTKGIAEKLFTYANQLNRTVFGCVRGGNVLGSNGSVVPVWINQIREFNHIQMTDPDMTRFFLTLPQAISLIFEAVVATIGGELFVMKMPSCRLGDLADVLIEHHGNKNTKINITGSRPGEKTHECLISLEESSTSYQWNDNYHVIIPYQTAEKIIHSYKHLPKAKEFSSKDNLMDKKQIKDMLSLGGFL